MSNFDPELDADRLVTCPFDCHHQVLQKRLGNHIIKCQKQHPDYKRCPFNAQHYVKEEDYKLHLERCTNRATIDRFLVEQAIGAEAAPPVENYDYSSRPPTAVQDWQGEECWDDDEEEDVHQVLEEKRKAHSQSTIFSKTQGWEPAQKRDYYKSLQARKLKAKEKEKEVESEPPKTSLNQRKEVETCSQTQWTQVGKKSRIGANFQGVSQPPPIVAQPAPNMAQKSSLVQRTAIGRGKGCSGQVQERPTLSEAFKGISLDDD